MAYVEKVIFDTNTVRNESSPDTFLGGRVELKKFEKVADIILPEMVIDEIRSQKRKHLISKQHSFLENIFHKLRGVDESETKDFNIDDFISKLEEDEEINYTTIKLTDNVLLIPKIKSMAVNNEPPFDRLSDKGFKDVYIYFTVLEYLNEVEDKFVYFVTGDERLKCAFNNNPRVHVIKGFDEFQDYRAGYYREEYFVGKLQSDVDENIKPDEIRDVWLNVNENWVVKIVSSEYTYYVEVDFSTKEIIDHISADFQKGIDVFVNSGNFDNTHSVIAKLSQYTNYFSNEDIVKIVDGAVTNEQIYWIADDEDVKAFVKPLFKSRVGIMPDNVIENFKEYYE